MVMNWLRKSKLRSTILMAACLWQVCALCADNGILEGNYAKAGPPEGTDVKLQISLPKNRFFFGEPVNVFARFINTTDVPVGIVLTEEPGIFGIESDIIAWEFIETPLPNDRSVLMGVAPSLGLIPPKGEFHMVLADKLFPVGKSRFKIEYRPEVSDLKKTVGIAVVEEKLTSNELTVEIYEKAELDQDEKAVVERKIQRHIEEFLRDDPARQYIAQSHLIRLSRYSVPLLRECLQHKSSRVRANAVETLGRIADKKLAEEKGFTRDASCVQDLVKLYGTERVGSVRVKIIYALAFFSDVSDKNRELVCTTLKNGIEDRDKNARGAAGLVLLVVDKSQGIPAAIDKLAAEEYYPHEFRQMIYNSLKKETGQDFGLAETAKWKDWWEKHKREYER